MVSEWPQARPSASAPTVKKEKGNNLLPCRSTNYSVIYHSADNKCNIQPVQVFPFFSTNLDYNLKFRMFDLVVKHLDESKLLLSFLARRRV